MLKIHAAVCVCDRKVSLLPCKLIQLKVCHPRNGCDKAMIYNRSSFPTQKIFFQFVIITRSSGSRMEEKTHPKSGTQQKNG